MTTWLWCLCHYMTAMPMLLHGCDTHVITWLRYPCHYMTVMAMPLYDCDAYVMIIWLRCSSLRGCGAHIITWLRCPCHYMAAMLMPLYDYDAHAIIWLWCSYHCWNVFLLTDKKGLPRKEDYSSLDDTSL